tara:strand:+ start:1014 stop:1331 length:318 start_codon:yes stop_codon:yes gene_type:complete
MEVNVSTDSFDNEVIKAQKPVLVDFWAPWCGPCKSIAPHLKQIALDYADKIKVCKINVDDAPEIATQYTVMSIPAIFLFKDGQVMEKRVGVMNTSDLEKLIQPYV